jgi:hypothetical protein
MKPYYAELYYNKGKYVVRVRTETGSGSCPVMVFGISGAELSTPATRVLVFLQGITMINDEFHKEDTKPPRKSGGASYCHS